MGKDLSFSVGVAWDDIRPHGNTIGWTHVVWFTHCIPRHAFHLWLVIQKKLKTQDRLRQWDVSPTTELNLSRCPLCDLVPDSHDHLFFHCPFSSEVWSKVKVKANMHNISCLMDDIVNCISPFAKKKYGMGQPKLGIWYLKDSPFDLVAYTDSDYVGSSLDRKSTTGGCQFLGCRLISWMCKKQTVVANSTTKAEYMAVSSCLILNTARISKESVRLMMGMLFGKKLELMLFWSIVKAKTINGEAQLHALVDDKKIIITESSVRRDLQLPDEESIDCLPNSTIFEQLALMGYEKISQKLTFSKPFFSLQWKFQIHTILQCLSPKTTAWNEFSSTMASAIM
ncbi:uncharacterized mitochondrial protein-like protein [Tanacetum coccineum]